MISTDLPIELSNSALLEFVNDSGGGIGLPHPTMNMAINADIAGRMTQKTFCIIYGLRKNKTAPSLSPGRFTFTVNLKPPSQRRTRFSWAGTVCRLAVSTKLEGRQCLLYRTDYGSTYRRFIQ
jgi:hypothetical protein